MSVYQPAGSVQHLSKRKTPESSCNLLHGFEATPSIAYNSSTEAAPSPGLKLLLDGALSQATKHAYQSDLRHFLAYGGTIPSTPGRVAEYVAAMAEVHKPATVARRLVSIGKAHSLGGFENPVSSEIVKLSVRGLRRSVGCAQREAKPVLREDLFAILATIDNSVKGLRDTALLLLCFAGGFRRSEIVALDFEDIEHVQQGIVIRLNRSKTDQEGRGRKIAIPYGRGIWCPVRALEAWKSASETKSGPVFRGLNRHSQISQNRLSGQAVSLVLKARADNAGIDGSSLSGHSLRAGFATSAALAGASSREIRKQTGHRSDSMLNRYIREADLFVRNATATIL